MVCRGGPHNRRRDRRSGGGQKRPDTRGTCSGETEDDQQRLGGCATMNQKSAGLGLFFLFFRHLQRSMHALDGGGCCCRHSLPDAGRSCRWMHLESFLWCPVWSGDYFVPLGGMAPGARAGPPQSGNFYHRCTQYNLSPIHHPISKPTPPSPPLSPSSPTIHHPPSTHRAPTSVAAVSARAASARQYK